MKKAPFGAFFHQQLLEHLQVLAAFLATFLIRITRLLSRLAPMTNILFQVFLSFNTHAKRPA
jgi:hypothetical protein